MGQKVNPIGFRIGNVYTWSSRWFARKGDYSKNLLEDYQIRQFLMTNLKSAGVSKVEIERFFDKKTITIHVARPGVAIGRGGAGGKEIARRETIKDGAVPLHTIRARIDFVKIDAQIPKARIVGVKVWIYKGD